MKLLHLKKRKFASKVVSRQKRKLPSKDSNHDLCENYDMHVASQIKHCVKLQGRLKTTPCVKTFTQPAVVMVVTNMTCG